MGPSGGGTWEEGSMPVRKSGVGVGVETGVCAVMEELAWTRHTLVLVVVKVVLVHALVVLVVVLVVLVVLVLILVVVVLLSVSVGGGGGGVGRRDVGSGA